MPLICMAISLFTASCSSDDIVSPEAKEQMLTLTVSAGTEDEAPATRAELTESSKNQWKWEGGDQLMLVITNAGQKTVHTLALKSTKHDGLSAEFEGEVPASSITENSTYRFFYIGKTTDGSADRTISASDLSAGSINIDLSKQTGNLADLKRNCVLMATGKVVATSGGKAVTIGSIKLKNLFAVAHFAITTPNNTPLTKVGLRGMGVYRSAKVNLTDGTVTGVSEIGTVADPDENIFFKDGKTDFYVTFVPGNVAPSFDGYYAGSYTSVVTEAPKESNYDASKSFVYYKGHKAKFSVGNGKYVAITNGNVQYVMPIATYTYDLNTRNLKANSLIRWKKDVALKVTARRTVQQGYYQLAPEQWEMAIPRTSRKKGDTYIDMIEVGGKKYVSPEKYRLFDLLTWGTLNNPTLLESSFSATSDQVANQQDYGHMLKVGDQETRVMTSDEWDYLMPDKAIPGWLPHNNRVWREDGVTAGKWARCHIKALYEQRDDEPVWLRGCLIFPDDMTVAEAKALFTTVDNLGHWSNADNNETTFELIRNSGAVFIPFSAYRAGGSNKLEQWGTHANYATSSRSGRSMKHVKITPKAVFLEFNNASDPNQGCAVRLVQDY